ncbi:coxsackievirus and adenovirus receptor homolog [Oncorhynchus kisutch]|uniref:V-set and immunoglobulin domain containing 8b n=1 Tax=Oncorhynchus kisutch TaxID=8019 RepID=A0A8C7FUG3_ONCKI|nr:coxsackievirus and adenovirus receptor homolog [Oncorhynchus kisutch]XP_031685992.1 coxsackievirus and adenovirus receptor homolog [Oncorhynchus kisutch]
MVTLGKCLTCSRLQLAVMFVLTVYLNTDITVAMQITSTGSQTIQRAQGETVMLGCTYTPAPSDTGDLDIEWLSVHPDMTQKDQLVISYTGGQKLHYGDPSLSKRMDFTGDPALGDASVSISAVKASDTATYQCKVKKAPGVDMRKVTLVVMVPPSVPKCWVEGVEEKGADVSLRCKLSVGSTPLNYVWIRESGGAIPPTATQNSQTGELMIRNHSESYMGNYLCVVSNPVGKEQCKYTLHAYNPPNKAGIIAAAVIGALLLLLLLLLLIWLLICCYHKRRYEKEVAHEIREDAPAPESRPASRNSSFRSVLGFRSPPGAVYSSVTEGQPKRTESDNRSFYTNSSIGMPAPSKQKAPHLPPVLKYDGSNGYPV